MDNNDTISVFKAIPSDAAAPPYTDVSCYAKADSQPAKLIDNKDPDGLGRVKVQFNWAGVTYTGTVDADGRAELKAQVVLESIPEVGKNKVDKELQQEAAKKNEIFITREGISYTKKQWKEYQNKWHDDRDAANKK